MLSFSFVLQHSLLVCLEPPASPSDHVEILVTAAPGKADISVLTASHHAFIKKAQDLALLTDEDYMVLITFNILLNQLKY